MRGWSGPLSQLALVCLVAVPLSWFLSPVAGLGLLGAFLLASWLRHWASLLKLVAWLERGGDAEVPQGRGLWDDAFALLHRRARQDRNSRGEIEEALERFRRATSVAPDGVVILGSGGRIEMSNLAARDLLGIDPTRDRGALVQQLVRQPEFASFLAGEDFSHPLLMRTPPPRSRMLSIFIAPFPEAGRLLLARDITQLDLSERMQRDFVANVSHELRTPLTVICGFLEHLQELELEDRAASARIQALIQEQAARMVRLVNDLLTLSRLEAEGAPSVEEPVAIAEMIDDIVIEARQLSAGKHTIVGEADPRCLTGDPSELRSAITNLVTNAVRYTQEGGEIRVRWTVAGGNPEIVVSDNGIGIAADHLPRLTERFYRVDRSRSVETGGTGLGLAIVRQVLVRHQAQLLIESQTGRGSTFIMRFPAGRLAAADAKPGRTVVQAG